MNTLKDIQDIINDYYAEAGRILDRADYFQSESPEKAFQDAAGKLSKGLMELKNLKLYEHNRIGLKVLFKGFEKLIKAMRSGSNGKYKSMEKLIIESGELLQRYQKEVNDYWKSQV